jgi:hypothetical protein
MAQRVSAPDTALDTTGGGGGGGAVTIADGANVTQGALADAAVVGDNSGTVSAKLRGLSKIFNDVWDSVNHFLLVKATQSGSWTVTSNAGTNLNTSALALEAGNLATLAGAVSSSKVQTQAQVASSGGSIPYHNLTAATTNFTNVKGAATQCYGLDISNTSASTIFVKLYDKATVPGTGDTPKRTIQVPANSTVCRAYPEGVKFTAGFGWAATGLIADNDSTAIAANCAVDFNLAT